MLSTFTAVSSAFRWASVSASARLCCWSFMVVSSVGERFDELNTLADPVHDISAKRDEFRIGQGALGEVCFLAKPLKICRLI
ncbi:hypothetical protein WK80_22430 [Burkholderia multivorans]|nr:hypothetical protein WK80_22430 [Burkholderia multivorans]